MSEVRSVGPIHEADAEGIDDAATQAQLAKCLKDTANIPGVDIGACEALEQKLAESTFNLVVAGQFKRGKSSVINALLGEALLPTGVVPLTSIVTAIRFGVRKAATIELQDGRDHTIPIERLELYVTERGNPSNAHGIKQVLVDYPSGWLARGIHLVDTPGIGSVYQHNTDVAQQYLPQADAVLFIASADQPLGTAELDFLTSIRTYAEKIFCLLNKTDYLSPTELPESVAFAAAQIQSTLGKEVPLFAVSARLALQAKRDQDPEALARSGFLRLEQALDRFMAEEQSQVFLRSVGRALLRILSQLRFTLELEAKLLKAPQKEIDQKVAAFHHRKLDLKRSETEHKVLLEADARMLLTQVIEPTLVEFKTALQGRVGAQIEQWYAGLSLVSPKTLREELETKLIAEIRAAYDGWLSSEDARLRDAFGALCERIWSDLQGAVDDLMRFSSKLFSLTFEAVPTQGSWTSESSLYYKFWYEPTSLRILTTSFVSILPKALAGPMILRRTQTRALEVIEAQAGRIRHDLEERLKRSVHDVQLQISVTTESIVERVESAIQRGMQARLDSAERVALRGRELADSIHTLERTDSRVRALVS